MRNVLLLVISYLFGSIPWALIIGKVFFHKDIRLEGSGNPGASNAGRVLGRPIAVIVTLLDALKAFFSMALASILAPKALVYAGLACCFGHCFPLFAKFHGGKAVATSYGFLLGIAVFVTHDYLWMFLLPILGFFALLYFFRMVSAASIFSLLLAVLISFFRPVSLDVRFSLLILWFFVTWRHRANIQRIRKGTESKIHWMGKTHGTH